MNSNSLNLALRRAARKLSVPQDTVEQVYKSYWSFVKETIQDLPLKQVGEEGFGELTTNFNIPYIGKIYADYKRIKKYNNQLKFYQNVRAKKNQANGQSGAGD